MIIILIFTKNYHRENSLKKRYYLISIILIIGIDQLIKSLVAKFLTIGEIKPLIGNAIRLNYTINLGAAFNMRK